MRKLIVVAVCLLIAACAAGRPQDEPAPPQKVIEHRETPAPVIDAPPAAWRAAAASAGLDPAAIAQLEADGLLITNRAYRQIFTPYVLGKLPPFITSDALLNAFHVLFEESVRRLEIAAIEPLLLILNGLIEHMPDARKWHSEPPELFDIAARRARVMLAVARSLLGEPVELSEAEAAIVEAEVARVEAAAARMRPEWLGPPDDGFMAIDYARFKPVGFYAAEERLARFYRATKWLQTIPMRAGDDTELATAMLLGTALMLGDRYSEHRDYMQRYTQLLGPADDLSLFEAKYLGSDLAGAREKLRDVRRPRVNDQDRNPPQDGEPEAALSFRVLPAYLLAESPMLQKTGNASVDRVLPSGLDVAAMLGSRVARARLPQTVLAEVDKHVAELNDKSLHRNYLDMLRELNTPDAAAPKLFRSEAWQIKSCNTQLAAWAQMRHTWALQAKQYVYMRMHVDTHPGFVEPVPEFFSALAELCRDVHRAMRRARAFEPDIVEYARLLREYARLGEEQNFGYTPKNDPKDLTSAEWYDLRRAEEIVETLRVIEFGTFLWEESADVQREAIAKLRDVAAQLIDGTYANESGIRAVAANFGEDFEQQWRDLEGIARRCEALAHKQMRELDFNASDREFLENFGKQLGGVMFYRGNSWLAPRDDAPRVVDIAWSAERDLRLLVGVARPRALYVLYPWKGQLVLSEGAVLPYYEWHGQAPLTNVEWTGMLDSKRRPVIPEWLAPIVNQGRLDKPEFGRD